MYVCIHLHFLGNVYRKFFVFKPNMYENHSWLAVTRAINIHLKKKDQIIPEFSCALDHDRRLVCQGPCDAVYSLCP